MVESTIELKDLRKTSQEELIDFLNTIGEKEFKAKQINEWIWKKSARS
ncbi:MAG: 23S rRNA (adenine(2503)-C(2))-methyltransferase RlmN, partial [Cyclobacteriaceae bacterium]|nr:23S rRNA (adenine(2503)-C(2))-methyltransferase RlmN [Cyclobacteriaceae bacterium]